MKGHNQNKYLHNCIKSNNLTHREWTEYGIKLGSKDLVCEPGFAAESPGSACVSGICCAGGTLCDGKGCPRARCCHSWFGLGVMDYSSLPTVTDLSPGSCWECLGLVFPGLQFELGACREDPCPSSCLRII